MAQKRGKLTAGKARERITSLEQSIAAREQKLEQLIARLERTENPEERLVTARKRLERRLTIEREQLEKLVNLLAPETADTPSESFVSEEIEDIHRSFEEMRQNVAQIQARFENTEVPRDLPLRLSSFEERIVRREEADSDLFAQVLSLQTNLDQERQTVRRLSRRIREQDHSIDALREAVEDSVVATVDLAERLEELEENITDRATPSREPAPQRMDALVQAATEGIADEVRELKNALAEAQGTIEQLSQAKPAEAQPGPDLYEERFKQLEAAHQELLQKFQQVQAAPAPASSSPAEPAPRISPVYGAEAVFRYGPLPKGRPVALLPNIPA